MPADIGERAQPARPAGSADCEPLWLGAPGRRLYAAFHPAPTRATIGVVLAPPLLSEQPCSRRLLFEIAGELATLGLPCLRFDYYGTGDSQGDGEAHDVEAMHADLDAAVGGLRELAGLTHIAVIAWRGAALVACDWAARADIDALILWDAVADGAAWLAELESTDRKRRQHIARKPSSQALSTGAAGDGQLMGFPVSPRWRRGIGALRLAEAARNARAILWAVPRDAAATPNWAARTFVLPPGTQRFDGDAWMDMTLFLSPPLRALVGELGQELMMMH